VNALAKAAFLTAAFACVAAADSPKESFAVAIVRRDGILVPFAAFDGKRWTNAWPPPKLDLQIPINVGSVPKSWWGPTPPLAEWQMWPLDGRAAPQTINVTQPDWIDAHCVRQIGLRTDYRSALAVPPPAEQPYPKDALAISPPHAIEPIKIISGGTEAASAIASGLRGRFNGAERETATYFDHPIGRNVREAIEPGIEALYAFGDATPTYYVEASRRYPRPGPHECVVAFGTGWFVRDPDRAKWLEMAVDVLPCNKYGATYMLPLGVVRAAGRTFWLAQYAAWNYERYVVVELKANRVEAVVSTWGGGC
jgi:hypothetical protein